MNEKTIIILSASILIAGLVKHHKSEVDISKLSDEAIEMIDFDYSKLSGEDYARVQRVKNAP